MNRTPNKTSSMRRTQTNFGKSPSRFNKRKTFKSTKGGNAKVPANVMKTAMNKNTKEDFVVQGIAEDLDTIP